MELALKQRRLQILGDCRNLKTDADFYNDNHSAQEPIQLIFDFSDDLAEGEQPGEFVDEEPL